jgi:uncharacterized integral membrane protein
VGNTGFCKKPSYECPEPAQDGGLLAGRIRYTDGTTVIPAGDPRKSLFYVVVLAVIVLVLLAVALYRATQVKTKADYLVAGRSLPAVVLVLTLLTSWIGAGSVFAGQGYHS